MCISEGLPSAAMLLFKRPIRGLLPQMNMELINIDNDDAEYEALKPIEVNTLRTVILAMILFLFL